jgi:hypothetical protein
MEYRNLKDQPIEVVLNRDGSGPPNRTPMESLDAFVECLPYNTSIAARRDGAHECIDIYRNESQKALLLELLACLSRTGSKLAAAPHSFDRDSPRRILECEAEIRFGRLRLDAGHRE